MTTQPLSFFPSTASFQIPWKYPVFFEKDCLSAHSGTLKFILEKINPPKALSIIDNNLWNANEKISSIFSNPKHYLPNTSKIIEKPIIISGGEEAKNNPSVLKKILNAIHTHDLCRDSVLIVAGGGAVLDVGSYAGSIIHRGMKVIRIPSTTLSQCDSGVAVKCGINAMGQKNMLGSFAPPAAVINDPSLLMSLHSREFQAGFSEIVKVALLKEPSLLEKIESCSKLNLQDNLPAWSPLIADSCRLHLEHITNSGDPFERRDARPLDLGHWSAHRLEIMTNFELNHGEAVAIGLGIDLAYGALLGILPEPLVERVDKVLTSLGLPITHPILHDPKPLLEGIKDFQNHLGGRLSIPLIRDIGKPLDLNTIDTKLMRKAILSRV